MNFLVFTAALTSPVGFSVSADQPTEVMVIVEDVDSSITALIAICVIDGEVEEYDMTDTAKTPQIWQLPAGNMVCGIGANGAGEEDIIMIQQQPKRQKPTDKGGGRLGETPKEFTL